MAVARELLRESDELPWLTDDEPELDPAAPMRELHPHFHHLCGHLCNSGACESELNAICIYCEFVLQEDLDREARKSYGMNRHRSD